MLPEVCEQHSTLWGFGMFCYSVLERMMGRTKYGSFIGFFEYKFKEMRGKSDDSIK
jgi:hypothetical protein